MSDTLLAGVENGQINGFVHSAEIPISFANGIVQFILRSVFMQFFSNINLDLG